MQNRIGTTTVVTVGLTLLVACGAKQTPATVDTETLDVPGFVRAYAMTQSTLADPEGGEEALREQLRSARGRDARKAAQRALAVHYFHALHSTDDRKEQRTARRSFRKWRSKTAKKNTDSYLQAELEFMRLYAAWQANSTDVEDRGQRFTENHRDSLDLYNLAWAIRGEVELRRKRYKKAAQHYRYLLALIDHPLYAFALYRTGAILKAQKRDEEAQQAFKEAMNLGCAIDAPEPVREVALAAAAKLGVQAKVVPGQPARPSTCDASAEESRDNLNNEVPPALQ